MDCRQVITVEPGKRNGKPCVRGLRVTVVDVLEHSAGGMTPGEIVEDFPELTPEDIRACLAFAADLQKRLPDQNPSRRIVGRIGELYENKG